MDKAILSKFLVDRIHKDWIDRLFPQGWMIERDDGMKRGRRGQGGFLNNIIIPTS